MGQPPLHGTRARYLLPWKCRCDECVRANAEYMRAYRLRSGITKGTNGKAVDGKKKTAQHGTRTRYINYRCRCDECVQANRDYQRKWMSLHRQGIPWRSEF